MRKQKQSAFTIVELLIVIVVIGILAAISIVAYNGIQNRAVVASLQSDLTNASQQIKLFQVDSSNYPATIDCSQPDSATNKCIKASSSTSYQYIVNNTNPQTFCIAATKNNQSYSVRQNGLLLASVCPLLYLDASDTASYPGTGTTWTDLSGNGNNGTLMNGVGYTSANGGALTFNGVDTYVSSLTSQNYLDITIIFQPDFSLNNSPSPLAGIVASGISTDESLRFANVNGVGPWSVANPGNVNDWASSSTSYVINGNVSNQVASGWNILSGYRTNQSNFPVNFAYYLGSGYPGRYFKGKIAAVLMYNRQLSDAEHKQIFNALKGRYGL
ncbi:type II secretion system protein [Candidatus Saccharibacteria bacterium]|nr:type II secretion system protein [Candidatus Saccharibacteria bacterium]